MNDMKDLLEFLNSPSAPIGFPLQKSEPSQRTLPMRSCKYDVKSIEKLHIGPGLDEYENEKDFCPEDLTFTITISSLVEGSIAETELPITNHKYVSKDELFKDPELVDFRFTNKQKKNLWKKYNNFYFFKSSQLNKNLGYESKYLNHRLNTNLK